MRAAADRDPPSVASGGEELLAAYRAFVGPSEKYDLVAALQFTLLFRLGLREHHFLLDVGCGSLRGGRLFIPYLLPGRYYGIEPHRWLIDDGLEHELGRDILRVKRPTFTDVDDFRLTVFGRRFDYILAQSIFSHAARPQIERCLSEARESLEPDGTVVATFVEGQDDYLGHEWVYPDVVRYRRDTIRSIAEMTGFRFEPIEWEHPQGQQWFKLTLPDAPKRSV